MVTGHMPMALYAGDELKFEDLSISMLDPDKLEEVKECRQLMHDVLSNDPADRGKPDPWIARLHGKGWTHVGGK